MIDPIFFLFISITIVSFGLQSVLLTTFVRRLDALIVSVYRSLSLAVVMLPVLLFSPVGEIWLIMEHLPTLILASVTGTAGFICSAGAARYLPVGVAGSVRQIVFVSGSILLGALLLHEYLSPVQLVLLLGIVGSGALLMFLRSNHAHLDPTTVWRGFILSMCGGITGTFAFYYFSVLAREINPYVASYFWEAAIGVFSFGYFLVLRFLGRYVANPWLSWQQAWRIVLISSLTIVATLSFAFAVTYGPYALASGLMTVSVLVVTLVGWILLKERLTVSQILLIVCTVFLMFLLRIYS